MGSGRRQEQRSVQREFISRRQGLERLLQGEEAGELTETTRSEFQKRVEALATRSQEVDPIGGGASEAFKELTNIEEQLSQAQKGEGRFGERQAIEKRRELLQDRPGRRQIFSFNR